MHRGWEPCSTFHNLEEILQVSVTCLTCKSVSRFYFPFTFLVCLPRWVHSSFFAKASLPGDCALMITLLTLWPKADHQQKLSFSSESQSFPLEWSFLWLSKNETLISFKWSCSRENFALHLSVHKWLKNAMDIVNVLSHPILRQIEDRTLIGRAEVTFIMEIRIYIIKCTYTYGFLFLIILGKDMSYHTCHEN